MKCIVVDKSTDHAKPHAICSYHNIKDNKINIFVSNTENTDSDLKVHALHYANELLERVRLSFQKLPPPPHSIVLTFLVLALQN